MSTKKVPTYLVSLEADVGRREKLKINFPNAYSDFIHIKAVDGRKLEAKEYFEKTLPYFLENNKVMSPAELGCTLSHINALEAFLKTGEPFALILEDDVIGSDPDLEKIFSLALELNEDSLLLCGAQEGLLRKYQLGKWDSVRGIYKVSSFSYSFIFRTCCYVVTRTSAQQIVDFHKKNLTLADKWGLFFKGTKTQIFYKNILSHPDDFTASHIESDRRKIEKSFIEKLLSIDGPKKVFNKIYFNVMVLVLKAMGFKNL